MSSFRCKITSFAVLSGLAGKTHLESKEKAEAGGEGSNQKRLKKRAGKQDGQESAISLAWKFSVIIRAYTFCPETALDLLYAELTSH